MAVRRPRFPLSVHVDDHRPILPGRQAADFNGAGPGAVCWGSVFPLGHVTATKVRAGVRVFVGNSSRKALPARTDAIWLMSDGCSFDISIEDAIHQRRTLDDTTASVHGSSCL